MHDRASCNNVAMRTIQVVYPNILDKGCYSHTNDRVGEQFKVPTLDEFGKYWVSLFTHSSCACLLWQERTSQAIKTYSETRWSEVLRQLMMLFGNMLPFLQENVDVSPSTRGKLIEIITNPIKKSYLMVGLAVVIDVGEHFVKATYNLEADNSLVLSCFEILSTVNAVVLFPHLPNTESVIQQLSGNNPTATPQWMQYARDCIDNGLRYFNQKFTEELNGSMKAFKAARLFVPYKLEELKAPPAEVDSFTAFPFVREPSLLDWLKKELLAYIAKATDLREPADCLAW